MRFHRISAAPMLVAPFSLAVELDGCVLVTGRMATHRDDGAPPLPEEARALTRRVMDNLEIDLIARRSA